MPACAGMTNKFRNPKRFIVVVVKPTAFQANKAQRRVVTL
jgi:hypothetical protein